jgi:hypothetical protein
MLTYADSLGLLMWELIEGEIPFHDVPNLDGMLPILWQVCVCVCIYVHIHRYNVCVCIKNIIIFYILYC